MASVQKSFFNLPQKSDPVTDEKIVFESPSKHSLETSWRTFKDQEINKSSLYDLFANRIPVIRVPGLLNASECEAMLRIVETHELGHYDLENTWPRVGTAGITQYDHISDKSKYFDSVEAARSLQARWEAEAGVDVLQRVMGALREASGMPVRLASENDKNYFAGILRAVDRGIGVHADFAPYEAVGWNISGIAAQVTWNILLNKVPGGDTLIYDRQWQAPDDDIAWRKDFPRDSYHPQMLDGHPFKAMKAVPGDLTFFNPRNFHEVKACDTSKDHPVPVIRFTISSFVGFLPARGTEPETLVLWS